MKGLEEKELREAMPEETSTEEEGSKKRPRVAAGVEVGDRWYEQIFKKTKEWFETEPDSDI